MTVLVLSEGTGEQAQRATEAAARAFPGQCLRTIAKGEPIEERGVAVVIPWLGRPYAPAPSTLALRHRLAGRRAYWIDAAGAIGRCGLLFFARELPRWLAFRALDALLRPIARALCAPAAPVAVAGRHARRQGPIVLVIPVVPDLSHTFVYREVLALLARRRDLRVVCLERGSAATIHAEAARVAERTAWLPRRGIAARCAGVLAWMLRAPRRTGALLALYARREGGTLADLLGKDPLRDPRHPGRCFELAAWLRRLHPRHLHVYGSTYAANVAMGAALLLDVPFSISSYVDFDFDYDFKMLEQKVALARFFRVCTRFCQQRVVETLRLQDVGRVPMLVYGLDLERWNASATPPGQGILLTAARLVEKKGLHVVPRALARLERDGVAFRWVVAGDGPELPRLRALISELGLQDRVELLGPVSNERVHAELLHADLALLPCVIAQDGERDGIPNFVTEAMALGVPVLTTPVSGIPELVRHGDTGFLAEPGDSHDLAAKLAAVLGDAGLRAAVAARGRAAVHATQDVEQSAAELSRILDAEP